MSSKDDKNKKYARHRATQRRNNRILIFLSLLLVAVVCFGLFMLRGSSWQDIYAAFDLRPAAAAGPQTDLAEGESAVAFLSVGQGDCTVIRDGDTVTVIDAGIYTSEDAIRRYLDSCGVTRIDYLIATHPHTDHIGSMAALIRHYEIGTIYFTYYSSDLTPTNETYLELLRTIQRAGIKTVLAQAGETLALPDGTIQVLSAGGYTDLNNCSIVLRYDHGAVSFLLPGDAETVVERALIDARAELGADVLKAGHHGSKNATSNDFLSAVKPRYVVFSCGLDNEYGYPKEQVLERVAAVGATPLRTDLMGNIVFVTDGSALRVTKERE